MNKAVTEQKIFLNQIGIEMPQNQTNKTQINTAKQYLQF